MYQKQDLEIMPYVNYSSEKLESCTSVSKLKSKYIPEGVDDEGVGQRRWWWFGTTLVVVCDSDGWRANLQLMVMGYRRQSSVQYLTVVDEI